MSSADNPQGVPGHRRKPLGSPYKNVGSGRSVSMLGVGMVVGAVIGAGIALVIAPQSGADTRRILTRRVTGLRRGRGVWGKLGRELRRAAAAKQKSMAIEAKRREVRLREAAGADS